MDAFVQCISIAALKIGTATPFDQQCIPGKDPVAGQVAK